MDKFGRNYTLFIQGQSGDILEVTLPLTLEFDITRKLIGSANYGSFRIYNLDRFNRNELRFNMYNFGQFRSVKLYAGYGKNLALIFSGNIHEAWSVRENVNFITQVECFDAGFAYVNSPFTGTPGAGTDQIDIIKQIVNNMSNVDPNVSVGAISNSYSSKISRANPQNGESTELIKDMVGNGFFIDNGKVNCLQNNECLEGDVPVISADSGLLGTPKLEQNILMFDMVFEPRLKVGQLIELVSTTDRTFTGVYKITSVHHRGTISDAVCGDAVTSVSCLQGLGALQLVTAA